MAKGCCFVVDEVACLDELLSLGVDKQRLLHLEGPLALEQELEFETNYYSVIFLV